MSYVLHKLEKRLHRDRAAAAASAHAQQHDVEGGDWRHGHDALAQAHSTDDGGGRGAHGATAPLERTHERRSHSISSPVRPALAHELCHDDGAECAHVLAQAGRSMSVSAGGGTASYSHSHSHMTSPLSAAIVVPLRALPADDERTGAHDRHDSNKETSPLSAGAGGRRGSLIADVSDSALVVSLGKHDALVVPIDDPDKSYVALLGAHTCYDAMPQSNRVIVLDTKLNLKRAFYSLLYNSTRTALLHRGEATASQFCGVISITDLIHAVRKCHADATAKGTATNAVEAALASTSIEQWIDCLHADGINRSYTYVLARWSLLKAAQVLLAHKLHRVPVVNGDTGNPLYVLTPERLLQYIVIFGRDLPPPPFLDSTPKELGIGAWSDLVKCYTDDSLWDTLELLCACDVSGVPVLERHTDRVVDIYSRFDAIGIAAHNQFDCLRSMTVDGALQYKASGGNAVPLVTCAECEPLRTVVLRLIEHGVHRIVVVDAGGRLSGVVTASDLLRHLVVRPSMQKADSFDGDAAAAAFVTHMSSADSSASGLAAGSLFMDTIPEHDVIRTSIDDKFF